MTNFDEIITTLNWAVKGHEGTPEQVKLMSEAAELLQHQRDLINGVVWLLKRQAFVSMRHSETDAQLSKRAAKLKPFLANLKEASSL